MRKTDKVYFSVYWYMSDANAIVMLEARVEELQTHINKLTREKRILLEIAKKYIPNEKFEDFIKEVHAAVSR